MRTDPTKKITSIENDDDSSAPTESTDSAVLDSSTEARVDESISPEQSRDLVPLELKPVELDEPDTINVANQLVSTVQTRVGDSDHTVNAAAQGSLALFAALQPADAQESILGRLLVGATNAAMASNSRSANAAGVPEYHEKYSKLFMDNTLLAIKLSEAFDRHRGLQQQNVNVGQVNVHPGGQAVVGNVTMEKKNDTPSAEPIPENGQTSEDED